MGEPSVGNWYFLAEMPGLYPAAAGIAICEHDLEPAIVLKLAPVHEEDRGLITVNSTAAMIETIPMPFCQTLDLSPPPKTTTRRWWKIFR
jgi:hypothetical protein